MDKPTVPSLITLASPIPTLGPDDFGFDNADLQVDHKPVNDLDVWLPEKYIYKKRIAQGGMGQILLAQERLTGRFVAIKLMSDRVGDPRYVQQFIREAIITARLQHPHIIPVYDLGFFSENKLYYTMRYIQGRHLSDIIVNNAPDQSPDLYDHIRIFRSAVSAVHYAHSFGLWHRDLKPDNILVGPLDEAYVIDWGLVSIRPGFNYRFDVPRIMIDDQEYQINARDNLIESTREAITTNTGVLMGTPTYMSPEAIRKDVTVCGAVSDIWSLGIILYEMITGCLPFHGSHHMVVMNNILNMDLVAPEKRNGARRIDPQLSHLCMKMLEKNTSDRIQDLSIVIKELTSYLKTARQTGLSLALPNEHPFMQAMNTVIIEPKQPNPKASPNIQISAMAEDLLLENKILRRENDIIRKKNEILAEIVHLGAFEGKRRRQLMIELSKF